MADRAVIGRLAGEIRESQLCISFGANLDFLWLAEQLTVGTWTIFKGDLGGQGSGSGTFCLHLLLRKAPADPVNILVDDVDLVLDLSG